MFKLMIGSQEIAYLKNVKHGEPSINLVGGFWQERANSTRVMFDRPAQYDERTAKMWLKRLAKFGYVGNMVAI